ncbi:NAD-dependent epimerase/dehydratase family protein [Krasilnikovia sp. MM14-A1259]|uniref:NAD-dependent epimerase/dehydratase family protein n=1 Tax=Krasilnikovia sp. MM14-A1259 TaxID=3373539 RepID=UPI00381EC711
MRALVTGSAGLVGRHVSAELERRGWVVDRCDILSGWDALDVFRQGGNDCIQHYGLVVHAAASSPHRAAIDGEPQHFARNLQLDSAMFDWAVRTGQGRVLYLSSSAAYPVDLQSGQPQRRLNEYCDLDLDGWVPVDDGWYQMTPDANYGWTKFIGERLAEQARAAGLPVTVVRPFSGYGEDQAEDFPFRALVERARRREDPFVIWGDGNQVRDWIHIDDVVAGMLAVAESGTEEPVNLCTGVGWSMAELAHIACDLVGHKPRFEYLADKPAGVAYRVGDPARFHEHYKPTVTLAEGIARSLR